MPDKSLPTRIARAVTHAARWRPGSYRQIWLIVLALIVAFGAEAIAIPAKRGGLPYAFIPFVGLGLWASALHRDRPQRERREALAARLGAESRADIPADVIVLAAAGMKIQAIKRYRELTGASLRGAKDIIDNL